MENEETQTPAEETQAPTPEAPAEENPATGDGEQSAA